MPNKANASSGQHVMLLYDDDDERNISATDYINEGLRRNCFCIYASVHANDKLQMSKISSRIANYKENIDNGNLLIVNFESFYKYSLSGDLSPFQDLKVLLEEIVQEKIANGKSGEVIAVADCADNLSRNKMFDECVRVERWWQDTHLEWIANNQKITVICPHPSSVLDKNPFINHKQMISRQHSLTIAVSKLNRKLEDNGHA